MPEGSSLEERFKGRKVLPTNVKPLHYSVSLQPNLISFKYTGSVAIE
jgi:aminopeptidase 2